MVPARRLVQTAAAAELPEVTVSIGITTYDGESEVRPEDLLLQADLAMYSAKTAGRNQVEVYRPGAEASLSHE